MAGGSEDGVNDHRACDEIHNVPDREQRPEHHPRCTVQVVAQLRFRLAFKVGQGLFHSMLACWAGSIVGIKMASIRKAFKCCPTSGTILKPPHLIAFALLYRHEK